MTKQKAILGTVASVATILGIPLAIALWYFKSPANVPDVTSKTTLSSKGNASPVINAGRDAVLGLANSPNSNQNQGPEPVKEGETPAPTNGRASVELSSTGDGSPVINAGRDAIVNLSPQLPDFVTDHDGAGALLMTEPDFAAFIDSAISGKGERVIGRLVNGTGLSMIELKEGNSEEPTPPWAKVKVLEGTFKDKEGWILMKAIRKPR